MRWIPSLLYEFRWQMFHCSRSLWCPLATVLVLGPTEGRLEGRPDLSFLWSCLLRCLSSLATARNLLDNLIPQALLPERRQPGTASGARAGPRNHPVDASG